MTKSVDSNNFACPSETFRLSTYKKIFYMQNYYIILHLYTYILIYERAMKKIKKKKKIVLEREDMICENLLMVWVGWRRKIEKKKKEKMRR